MALRSSLRCTSFAPATTRRGRRIRPLSPCGGPPKPQPVGHRARGPTATGADPRITLEIIGVQPDRPNRQGAPAGGPGGVAGRQMGPRRRESEGSGGWDPPGGSAPRHALAGSRTGSRAAAVLERLDAQPCPATVAIVSPFLHERISERHGIGLLAYRSGNRQDFQDRGDGIRQAGAHRVTRLRVRERELAYSAQTHDMRTRWLELEATAMSIAEFWIRQVRYIPDSPECRAVNRVAIGRLHRSVVSA